MSCVWRRECQARQRNTCAVMKVHPRMIRMNRNENMWCIIITAHPKIDGKLGEDAKKQPQTNIECLRTAHPSLHMTEYHRLIHLHSILNQSFRCSRHAKSASTHIPPAAGAQDQPSNRWAIFWGPHLLWLSSWTLQRWFCRDAPEITVISKVHFYFWVSCSFKGIVRDLGKCWHCVCFKIGLSYACWVSGSDQTPVGSHELSLRNTRHGCCCSDSPLTGCAL